MFADFSVEDHQLFEVKLRMSFVSQFVQELQELLHVVFFECVGFILLVLSEVIFKCGFLELEPSVGDPLEEGP
jgi:hypothetical protein